MAKIPKMKLGKDSRAYRRNIFSQILAQFAETQQSLPQYDGSKEVDKQYYYWRQASIDLTLGVIANTLIMISEQLEGDTVLDADKLPSDKAKLN